MGIKLKQKPNTNSKIINQLFKLFERVYNPILSVTKKFWNTLCKNKHFSHFVYVTLPNIKNKAYKYVKTHRKRALISTVVFAVVLCAILGTTIINAVNSDYLHKGTGKAEYAMVLQDYHTFDHSEETRIAIKLNWDDGAIDLQDGKAEAKIKATVYPFNLENKKITWKSSNDNIARIDNSGNITAENPGDVTLTATLSNYTKSVEAKLSVNQSVTGIFLPSSNIVLYKNGSGRLINAEILPKNSTNKNITWKSKNTKVARVDSSGHVKPVGIGMTEIIATTEDGNFEGKCFVSVVNEYVEVENLSLKNPDDMTIKAGEHINAIVTVSPSESRNKTLKWSSDDTEIATVSQAGRIKGISVGEAVITAESTNGKRLNFKITVTENDEKDPFDLTDTEMTIASEGTVTYTSYDTSFPQAVRLQISQNQSPKIWRNGTFVAASEAEVAEYMNPNNYYTDAYKYQFLDLSSSNGISEDTLNAFLAEKGVMKGMGKVFIEAANKYNISEVYLVAHACLESSNGTSQLAKGVSTNGTTVYNLFGIGAYDSNAVSYGSKRAYELGWTSVEKAIMGGAEWISENYINRSDYRQNTLYKMRWNPECEGQHLYATDIAWAVKQAISIEKIFSSFENATLSFDIPVYSGQIPPTVTAD